MVVHVWVASCHVCQTATQAPARRSSWTGAFLYIRSLPFTFNSFASSKRSSRSQAPESETRRTELSYKSAARSAETGGSHATKSRTRQTRAPRRTERVYRHCRELKSANQHTPPWAHGTLQPRRDDDPTNFTRLQGPARSPSPGRSSISSPHAPRSAGHLHKRHPRPIATFLNTCAKLYSC